MDALKKIVVQYYLLVAVMEVSSLLLEDVGIESASFESRFYKLKIKALSNSWPVISCLSSCFCLTESLFCIFTF